jgi:hypothetical protein
VKFKWGTLQEAAEIDGWEPDEDGPQFKTYDGPRPPKGVYRFKITRMEGGTSSGGFRQMIVHLELDGSWKPEHAKFDGYYMRDYVIVKGDTGFRVKPLLDALGVTAKQMYNNTIAVDNPNDENTKLIQKIGAVSIPDSLVIGNIWPDKNKPQYDRIKYLRGASDDADGSGDDGGDDSGDADPPF